MLVRPIIGAETKQNVNLCKITC